jgi:hypothetical protein
MTYLDYPLESEISGFSLLQSKMYRHYQMNLPLESALYFGGGRRGIKVYANKIERIFSNFFIVCLCKYTFTKWLLR